MARHVSWTAWILFFAGLPLAFADHASAHAVCRYLGWGWGGGYHWCEPTPWYTAPCGCYSMNAGCQNYGMTAAPWEGTTFHPAHHAVARYYVPPVAYQPISPPRDRTANAQSASKLIAPSTLQSR